MTTQDTQDIKKEDRTQQPGPNSAPTATQRTNLIEHARHQCMRALVKAELFLDRELPMPQIRMDLRGKSAGIFQFRTQPGSRGRQLDESALVVRLNQSLLESHSDIFIKEVIPHEISHLAAYSHYGTHIRPHGKEWQNLMENCFRLPANIYHNFPVSSARQHARPYAYQCACGTHYFTARRHKNRLRGSQYFCQKCKGVLAYIGKLTAQTSQ